MILGLALAGGGFALADRHIAGLMVWLILVGMLALGAAGRATLGRSFYWTGGLVGVLALFSASSSLWSGSIELSVIEADRVLVYLGFFLAAFLIAQTGQRRQRFGEGIGIGLIGISLLAVGSRLLPDVFSIAEGPGSGPRLSYPLGYWNADGLTFGMAAALCLWMSRRSLNAGLRWLAVVSLPAILLALYFTYSRGGLLALLIACGCLIALSHDRLWLLATLAIGAVGALPAVLAVQARRSLAENLADPHIAGQGVTVLSVLLAGTLLAAGLLWALRQAERRQGQLTGRALALSRDPRILKGIALALAVIAIGAAVAVGGRAWHQFTSPDLKFPSQPEAHFGQLSGAGRNEFWRVALDAFAEQPVLGHGAGTYRLSWHLLRHNSVQNTDAHSLYLQGFAELGVLGGILVLAMVGTLLGTGFAAWRAARGARRELYAAMLAICLAFAVGAAIDWFWQIAVVAGVFFLASGVLVAARCAQLAQVRAAGNGRAERRRYGQAIAGLALAWVAALALIGPLLVDREIDASDSAVAAGNLASATSHAETARSIEPWATSPYLQLGLLAEREGNYEAAIERLDQAIEREEDNWLLYYVRARVQSEAGNQAAARADLREARRLNPEEKCLYEGFEGCG
ncbi:MAG TPA: O-antigen ligase family protein [Solirubrobacterales bacterium]|nr:O-antigen ligase family protein [Solirubrobacterales bacterium]